MTEPIYRKQGRRYVPAPEYAGLEGFDPGQLLACATRYYIGRMTIAACCHAEAIARSWHRLPERAKTIIRRDLEEEFRLDNESRQRGDKFFPLGSNCDREAWEMVRAAWMKEDDHGQPTQPHPA